MSIVKKDNVIVEKRDGKLVTDSNYVEISIEESEMKSVGVLKITRRTLTGEELPVIIINPKGIHKYDIVENEELILEVSDKEGRPLEEVVIVKGDVKWK